MRELDGVDVIMAMLIIFIVSLMMFGLFLAPHYEAKTFNKYKSVEQPTATYMDALNTKMVVVAGGGAHVD